MEGRRTSGRLFRLHPCHQTLGHHAPLSRQGSHQLPLEHWNVVTAANTALLPAAAHSAVTEHMLQDVRLTPFISFHIRTNTPLELGFKHGSSVRLSSSHYSKTGPLTPADSTFWFRLFDRKCLKCGPINVL